MKWCLKVVFHCLLLSAGQPLWILEWGNPSVRWVEIARRGAEIDGIIRHIVNCYTTSK